MGRLPCIEGFSRGERSSETSSGCRISYRNASRNLKHRMIDGSLGRVDRGFKKEEALHL